MTISTARQYAALLLAATLAMDYFRDAATFTTFANWVLVLHFFYFQLPLRSTALAYFHAVSFIGAFSIPPLYVYMLIRHPSLEAEHQEMWSVEWSSVVVRSFFVNIAPLLFHIIDLYLHISSIRHSYQTRPQKLILAWPLLSFVSLSVLYDFTCPDNEDTEALERTTIEEFSRMNKLITLLTISLSYGALYAFVLSKRHHVSAPARTPSVDLGSASSSATSNAHHHVSPTSSQQAAKRRSRGQL